jgi:hypothetical protein
VPYRPSSSRTAWPDQTDTPSDRRHSEVRCRRTATRPTPTHPRTRCRMLPAARVSRGDCCWHRCHPGQRHRWSTRSPRRPDPAPHNCPQALLTCCFAARGPRLDTRSGGPDVAESEPHLRSSATWPGGRSGLIVCFHHLLADGIGSLAVLARLTDASADRSAGCYAPPVRTGPQAPSRRVLAADA